MAKKTNTTRETLHVEPASVDSLSADPANVRTHDKRNIDAIKASLRRFGQQKPIVVDGDGVVVAGNGTLAAAQLNRKCYGLEISPAYCDVIVARWEKLTGQEAQREGVT